MSIPELFLPKPRLYRQVFPLRPGVLIDLYLPVDLTMADVKRLTAMLETLTVDGHLPVSSASPCS